MLKETVEVIDRTDGKVKIKFIRKPMCSCCKFSSFCAKGEDVLIIDAFGFSLEKGDKIEVGIEGKKTVLASLITFLIPMVIFVGLLLLFKKWGEIKSFLITIFFLTIYYIIVKMLMKKKAEGFDLRILHKL